jgi:subtilisin family serine protease
MKKKKRVEIAICILLIVMLSSCGKTQESTHDSEFKKQWGLENHGKQDMLQIDEQVATLSGMKEGVDIKYIGMWEALPEDFPQKDVVVALIDSGVDFSGPELINTQWKNVDEIPDNNIDDDKNGYADDINGWDFTTQLSNETGLYSESSNSHGTICAGIVAAEQNGAGIEGVTRGKRVQIMDLKILSPSNSVGEGSISNLISAIEYAEENGASICNLSLSTSVYDAELYDVIKNSKMLFITSAGNSTNLLRINIDKKKKYPACFDLPNIIAVANIGIDGILNIGSNIGPKSVKLAAPGTYIYSTMPAGEYSYSTGASFSAPFVTGVAVVLYQYMEYPTAKGVGEIICESVTKMDTLKGKVSTGGMLNGMKAVVLAGIYEKEYD